MAVKQKNEVRVWRATLNSQAGVMLRPDTLTLIGSENNFIHLDKNNVSICASKLNFTTDPMNISKGILFKEQLGFLQMLPSNMAMPVPNVAINIPGDGIVKAMKQPMSVIAAVQAGSVVGGLA
tara:strand:+ start:84 stop:452 length:369 start_codon:yes stop_codon:yes gene_type:complete